MNDERIKLLNELDELESGNYLGKPVFRHKEHRWVLPVIYNAQEKGLLDKPCNVFMFDRHHDCCMPQCLDYLKFLNSKNFAFDDIVELCNSSEKTIQSLSKKLSWENDDWIIAGMELGMIKDIVAFIDIKEEFPNWFQDKLQQKENYIDHKNNRHQLFLLGFLSDELGHKGYLTDGFRRDQIDDVLNWGWKINKFCFKELNSPKKALLDFDLDFFTVKYRNYILPWTDEIFMNEFINKVPPFNWSGKEFIHGLVEQSGIITIAKEPKHCGGDSKTMEIFNRCNKLVFDNRIKI